jgi:transposase
MDQKTQFIADYLRAQDSMSALCDRYGISRKTGYRFVERYLRHGPQGLDERSRRSNNNPNQTPEHVIRAIIELRQRHPSWGAKKLLAVLDKRHPKWDFPARSTACDILNRNGLVPKKRRRRPIGHPGKPTGQILAPNDVWRAGVQGTFQNRR